MPAMQKRWEEKGRGEFGWVGGGGREKNKQRMKAGAQKHQLKMTAAGKPGRETGETTVGDGKGGKKL